MSRRRKRLSREQSWFVLLLLLAVVVAFGLSAIFANITGSFNGTAFAITAIVTLAIFLTGYIILSLPSVKGRIGEARVNRVLARLSKKYGGHVIHDVMVLGDDGKTSQIDHVYVSNRGVFVIETKNYAGRIYGSQNQKQWTQVLAYGNVKNKLYNPVMQNHTHIRRLKEALPEAVNVVSAVVFVRGNIQYIDSENVYDLHGLKKLVKNSAETIPANKVESITQSTQTFKDKPIQTNKEHVTQIKATQQGIKEGICPRCGAELVLRTSKTDGRQFYGCSNFPKCRFTKKVD